MPVEFVNSLKSRLIFNIFYCFWMLENKFFIYLTCPYLKKWKCFNAKSSTYYFHMKTKIFSDFQICISVPLINRNSVSFDLATLNSLIYSTVFEHITKRVHNLVLSFRSLKQKKQKAFVNILLAIKNFLSYIF